MKGGRASVPLATMIDALIRDELDLLMRLGDELAERRPDLARFVRLDSGDPDVRQLIGSMAAVGALFQQRVREEVPHACQSLLRVLYPQELRPTPSFVVMELKPKPGVFRQAQTIPAGTPFSSAPIEPTSGHHDEGAISKGERTLVECGFRTTASVHVTPMVLNQQQRQEHDGRSRLSLAFKCLLPGPLQDRVPKRLRLFVLAENEETRLAVRAALLDPTVVISAQVTGEDGAMATAREHSTCVVLPVGFHTANQLPEGEPAGLLPWPNRADEALRILFELGVFPARFAFVDVDLEALGLFRANAPESIVALQIDFKNLRWPSGADSVSLRPFCTPAVNLFECDARPMATNGQRLDHLIVPDLQVPHEVDIFEVRHAWMHGGAAGRIPAIEETFRSHDRSGKPHTDDLAYHIVRTRSRSAAQRQTLLRLVGDASIRSGGIIGASLVCTNGKLAARLDPEQIGRHCPGSPSTVDAIGVSAVSSTLAARAEDDALWRVLGLISSGRSTRLSLPNLRDELDYSCPAKTRRASILRSALTGVHCVTRDGLANGVWNRINEVTFSLDVSMLSGPGDFALFADALAAWTRMAAPINTINRVVVVDTGSDAQRSYTSLGDIDIGIPWA
ncbi:MAG: hypothetical protein EA376_01880 [Phycisphaeraceae bacterium]|nr:MAG: hypothetical protein EA376_01880 [Phycisphaeraceae bacterium]